MAREEQEIQDLGPGSYVRFPHGRGVLWLVLWVDPSSQGVWMYGDSGLVRRTFHRDYGYPMKAVV